MAETLNEFVIEMAKEGYDACSEVFICPHVLHSKGSKCYQTHIDCEFNPGYVGKKRALEITKLNFGNFSGYQLTN
jgi:hypothetical protein